MNAYAGSLAWSNFFSRLTHSHPGRVVWLVFNVAIALLLMELGIYGLLEETLGIFSIIAMSWLCAISAICSSTRTLAFAAGYRVQARPSLRHQPGRLRHHAPVGQPGARRAFRRLRQPFASLSTFVTLIAFLISPLIAWATAGKFYLARKPRQSWKNQTGITCSICEHPFEPEDMAWCPAYAAPICSLCCTLDSRCHDMCKPHAKINAQAGAVARTFLPAVLLEKFSTRLGRYALTAMASISLIGAILALIAHQVNVATPAMTDVVNRTVLVVFFIFAIIAGIVSWFYVLAHDSRLVAEEESSRQNTLLLKEIAATARQTPPCRTPRRRQRRPTAPRAGMWWGFPTSCEPRSTRCSAMPRFWSATRPYPSPGNRRSRSSAALPTTCPV